MKDELVFLTAVSDYEVDLVCQRLKEAGIEYLVRDETVNAWQRQYGGVSLVGKEILVKNSQLNKARELLNIQKGLKFPSQKRKIFSILKIPVAIYLIVFFTFLLLQGYFLIKADLEERTAKNHKESVVLENSDWQTYTNEEYGFEIKYPKDWNTGESVLTITPAIEFCPSEFSSSGKGVDEGIPCKITQDDTMPSPKPYSLAPILLFISKKPGGTFTLDDLSMQECEKTENKTINNISIKINQCGDRGQEAIWYSPGNTHILRLLLGNNSFSTTFSKMLSTFKFIEINSIEYKNTDYGFTFSLPVSWTGYSIIKEEWQEDKNTEQGDIVVEKGPKILIRHPQWAAQNSRQDIPIMVFTINQWDSLLQNNFHIGAAPINPSELGRNAKYVFALPARYNYAFPTGWEEVENILKNNPLSAFNII